MIPRVRSLATLSLLILLVAAVVEDSAALTAGKIAEVNVSPDVRRVSIRTEGQVGNHAESTVTNPSRLVIDIAGASLAAPLVVSGAGRERGLGVRAAKNDSGVRLVLDFGASPVPAYRIRRVGSYLLVFLQDWHPSTGRAGVTGFEPTASEELAPVPRKSSGREHGWRASAHAAQKPERRSLPTVSSRTEAMDTLQHMIETPRTEEAPADLMVKSAEADNGAIVLLVARKSNPAKVYRIDLRIDLNEPEVRNGKISLVEQKGPRSAQAETTQSPFFGAPSPQPRIGPRKP